MNRYKPLGWRHHSYEHYLARRGIKTARRGSGVLLWSNGVPIVAKKLPKGMAYPLSPEEVKGIIEGFPKKDMKGLKRIEFVPPKDKNQEDAWAQYVRSRRTILIFGQKVGKDGMISGRDPKEVREHLKRYVIPHEAGHHVALKRVGTDNRLSLAEARADGYAFGMDVRDKEIRRFEPMHKV